jgi:serine/threonine protein phosphatase PrpC
MNIDPAIEPTGATDEAEKQQPEGAQPTQEAPQPADSAQAPTDTVVQADTLPGEVADAAQADESVKATKAAKGAGPVANVGPDTAADLADVVVFDTVVSSGGKDTTPLPENGGPPSPPLSDGTVLNERYQVVTYIGVIRNSNMYRVTDLQGYRRCWACGSDSSMPGDIYCVECGAQLAGRFYRLQEFSLPTASQQTLPLSETKEATTKDLTATDDVSPAVDVENGQLSPQSSVPSAISEGVPSGSLSTNQAAIKIVPAILENRVMGVAHVYELWTDQAAGRAYITWEEAAGRTLASWLPGSSVIDELLATQSGHLAVPQEPEEEQTLAWMVQAVDLLARLHDEGITGCSLELSNLLVQPGDRLLLLDPSGCTSTGGVSMAERDSMELSDVRTLATELEKWYMAVRKEPSSQESDPGLFMHSGTSNGSPPEPMVAAYEVTGPLGRHMNPAVALSHAREGSYPTAHAFAEVLRDLYEASKPLTNLKLWSGRSSDVGRVRKINEDSVLTFEATVLEHEGNLPVALYVIADGMGGHQSGEVASSIAVRTIGAVVNSSLMGPLVSGDPVARDPNTCGHLLQQAVLEANRRITDLARERHSDLGTTTVVALLIGNQLTVANVGDSRAYLWHDDGLQVITRDHSLVMQLVMAGQIKLEDIYTHPRRNEIYRALGDPRLTEDEIDVYSQHLRPGDGVLLCSDGLWDFVRDPDIAGILASPGSDPQALTRVLVDQANMNGGEDNISVIFARVMESET